MLSNLVRHLTADRLVGSRVTSITNSLDLESEPDWSSRKFWEDGLKVIGEKIDKYCAL
jgi:hypothetical protein